MIPGRSLWLGGREIIVPALTLSQIARLSRELDVWKADTAKIWILAKPETLCAVVAIITTALQRNYPELGTTQVIEMLDVGNLNLVMEAVIGTAPAASVIAVSADLPKPNGALNADPANQP
jgi:hypothetical protein